MEYIIMNAAIFGAVSGGIGVLAVLLFRALLPKGKK